MGWAHGPGRPKQTSLVVRGGRTFIFSENVCLSVKKACLGTSLTSCVVLGGRDNERFSKCATLFEKIHVLSIWSTICLFGAEISTIKRRAPKNDSERRWNFVKWTNGDPILTRKLGWIWSDFEWF